MAVNTTTIAYALKRVYTNRAVENAVYKDNPLLALMKKEGGFTGESHIHPIRYRDSMGRSSNFTNAQSMAQDSGSTYATGNTKGVQFIVTRKTNYQVFTLETEAILAGRDDKGSLVRTLTTEVDSALNNLGRNHAIDMYRDSFGALGQCSAVSGATTTATITVGEAITNFEQGMLLNVTNGSTKTNALRTYTGSGGTNSVLVISVDRDAGTFIVDNSTGSPGITANDWFYVQGERVAGSITTGSKVAGLDSWVPSSAPTVGDNFFGTDRSVDKTRLAGLRIDVSSLNPEEGLVTAMHKLAREGGTPNHLFMSYLDSLNVQKALGAKAETEYMSVGDIGFSTIRVRGPKGDVMIVPDQNAQAAVGNLLTMSTWAFKHLGDFINFLDLDGATLSREASADRFEGRLATYGNIVCYAPGQNARLVLPS